MNDQSSQVEHFRNEVRDRFGVLPNFFCSAAAAPGLIENMWGFAKSGYLDNPLPALFKERLFVHLSRFCEARYGCPFPELLGRECALRCCHDDPRLAIEQARNGGRNVFLWWWTETSRDAPFLRRDSVLDGIPGGILVPVPMAPGLRGWECYRIEVRVDAT